MNLSCFETHTDEQSWQIFKNVRYAQRKEQYLYYTSTQPYIYFPLTTGSQRYTVSQIKKTGMVHRTPIYISMHG
jgi:hypothetical protein